LVKLLDALNLEKGNGVGACMLFSRKVMETVGDFDPELELAEDYDYWIRVSKKFSMHHLAEPLYYYRSHVTSLSLRRFHEVRIAEILLKSKNKFAYDFSLTNLVELCAQKYPKHLGINSIAQRLIKRKIRRKLLDLEAGKISFKKAKLALQSIVEKQ
jgi:GT2 family glycosyltransferase